MKTPHKISEFLSDNPHAYGVCWDSASTDSSLMRIGNMENHHLLPVQNALSKIIIDRQHMILCPAFQYRFIFTNERFYWFVSPVNQLGMHLHPWFQTERGELAIQHIGAYEAFVDTRGRLCSLPGHLPTTGKTREEFRLAARKRGPEWYQESFWARSAVQLLYLIEFADWDIQKVIGKGVTTWSFISWEKHGFKPVNKTGISGKITTGSHAAADGERGGFMVYRGIENLIGHLWKFTDGINICDNRVFITNDPWAFEDDTSTGYREITSLRLPETYGYISRLHPSETGFLPVKTVDQMEDSSIKSYFFNLGLGVGWRVVISGGYLDDGASAGVAYLSADHASSNSNSGIGSRLCRME